MASKLEPITGYLLDFAGGQGAGAGTYVTYAPDLDTDFALIRTSVNQLVDEVILIQGSNAVLVLDLIRADDPTATPVSSGFMGDHSYQATIVTTGSPDDTVRITAGTIFGDNGLRTTLGATSDLIGFGGAVTFFVNVQANGLPELNTVATSGVLDIWTVDWDGAAFLPGTLVALAPYLVDGDDFQDSLSVVGVAGGSIPPQQHTRFANRLENLERALNGLRTNIVPGGPSIGPVLSLFRGGRMKFVNTNSVTLGSASLVLNLVPNSTAEFTIEWPGASPVTADITVSGAGGLDTGVEASDTWYAVYVIADTSGANPVDALLSVSFVTPTLPAGYDIFFRLGAVRNNSASDFLEFLQTNGERNRHHLWVNETLTTTQVLAGGSALVFATVSLAAFVPPSAQRAMITFEFDGNTASADFGIRRPGAGTTRQQSYFSVFPGTTNPFRMPMQEVWTSTTQTIEYEVNSGASALDLFVNGYTDELAGLI